MKHFGIVFVMSLFVILYVWQNIEIMKTKMDYKKVVKSEHALAERNAKLKLELEKLRNFSRIESNAGRSGLSGIKPSDVIVIKEETGKVKENDKEGK
ncbi:MAG TPA: cell division protein FtsL [Spirochaetota bacterium]|nr:cell division protein FtsL [Spirochaetota bacterium]